MLEHSAEPSQGENSRGLPWVNAGFAEETPQHAETLNYLTSRDFSTLLRTGNPAALNELSAALYPELHRIALRHIRSERPDHTLQATALIHEAYLKLADRPGWKFADKVHFLAMASRVMRQILVDHARARSSQKRSSGGQNVPWTDQLQVRDDKGISQVDLLELDGAIHALAAEDESLGQIIEMRFFGGMTAEETAEALNVSVHVVRHNLRYAQAWLRRKLKQ